MSVLSDEQLDERRRINSYALRWDVKTYELRERDALDTINFYKATAEQLEVQLAGCMTAATGWDDGKCKQGDYGWSKSLEDVRELRTKWNEQKARERELAQVCAEALIVLDMFVSDHGEREGSLRDKLVKASALASLPVEAQGEPAQRKGGSEKL